MGLLLLLAFIGIPLAEIGLFISVGDAIGLWSTLAVVIITAMIGTALLRAQGLATLTRAINSLNQGQAPLAEAFDGICLVFAGALLLTPGFLTDSVGFLLFIPPLRRGLFNALAQRLRGASNVEFGANFTHSDPQARPTDPTGDGVIIDGDFHTIDDDAAQDSPNSTDKPTAK